MGHREELLQGQKTRRAARFRKWAKNQFNRWTRRAAKVDPEDAPKKQGHRGYEL